MTRQKNDMQGENESQASFEAMVREKLQQAVRTALISVLEEEVDAFIGAGRVSPCSCFLTAVSI